MKFRINTTGSIVEPNDETVLEQMKNSPFYTAIPDVEPDAQEGDNEGVKPLSKMFLTLRRMQADKHFRLRFQMRKSCTVLPEIRRLLYLY